MKRLLVTLAVALMTFCAYAQRDIPAGASMEVASTEGNDNEMTLYKVKDKEGNPSFYLSVSHVLVTSEYELFGIESSFSASDGSLLWFGTTSEEAMANLDALLELFDQPDGQQMEFTCLDGSKILCTLHKGFLGKHLSIGNTSVTKSNIKSLKTSFKISKKLHPDI